MRADGQLGHKLGPRLSDVMVRATLATRKTLAPHEARLRQLAMQGIIDRAGLEVAQLHQPFIAQLLDSAGDQLPDHVAEHLRSIASGQHQWQALAGLTVGGVSGAIGELLSNELAPAVYGIVRANPQLVPDAGTIARSAAQGTTGYAEAVSDLGKLGYNAGWAASIIDAAQAWPSVGVVQDLVNRGFISEATGITWLKRTGLPAEAIADVMRTRAALISPADAALAVLRTSISQGEGEHLAAMSGVSAADFAILLGNTGEPLALESLLEARRRGFIDNARLDRGIRQSRVRDEWIDVVHRLEFAPMSTADAVDAAVQGHLTLAEAQAKAEQNGLEPGDFDALYLTAGEPLSRTEMETLYNRGEVTQAAVEQAIRESRVKDKYIPDAVKLHVRLPEARQIVSMLTHGAATKAQAVKLLTELGYTAEVAGLLVAEGVNARVTGSHALTMANIEALYKDRLITAAHAHELLSHLGYDQSDAAALMAVWDFAAGAALTRQAAGVVRVKYVAHLIDWPEAAGLLDSLNLPATARDNYRRVWDVEREAQVRTLTEAQTVAAHKAGLITGADALARLASLGYSDDDGHILLGVLPGQPVDPPGSPSGTAG
jgi:hypothetical protein